MSKAENNIECQYFMSVIQYELLMRILDGQEKINQRLDALEGKKAHVEEDRFKTLDYTIDE